MAQEAHVLDLETREWIAFHTETLTQEMWRNREDKEMLFTK